MSETVTSIRRTRPALSVEEVALREAEHDKALEVLTELLETHHDSAVETKADEVYKMTFTLQFNRAFSHTEVKGKVRYSRVMKDEAERVAKSPDQLQMELANGQGKGAA
jgi:hypothetical protein